MHKEDSLNSEMFTIVWLKSPHYDFVSFGGVQHSGSSQRTTSEDPEARFSLINSHSIGFIYKAQSVVL